MKNPFIRRRLRWIFDTQRANLRIKLASVTKGKDVDLMVHVFLLKGLNNSAKPIAVFNYVDLPRMELLFAELNGFVKKELMRR